MFWRPQKGKLWDKAVEAANAYPDQEWLLLNEPERGESRADRVEQAAILQDWVKETHNKFSIAGLLTSIDGVGWRERYLDVVGSVSTRLSLGTQAEPHTSHSGCVAPSPTWRVKRGSRPSI